MTKEEVRQLFELQVKFEKRCEEVCSILKDLDVDYENLNYYIIGGNDVFAIGYNNHDYEEFTLKFPASFLTSDDDVIRYVKNEKRKREEEIQRLKDFIETKERENALLYKLKEKYE